MNELIREIEEDMRRERFAHLWHRFGRLMVGLSVAVVLVTIVAVVLQNRKENAAMEQTALFIRGIDRMNVEDFKGAIAVFNEFASDSSSSFYGLAMLQKARAQEALDNEKGAAQTYRELADSKGVFSHLSALLASSQNGQPVEPDRSSPFYYTQLEWKGWQLLEQGKKPEAVAVFMQIRADLNAPMSMRVRMNEVVQHVAPQRLRANSKDIAKDGPEHVRPAK